MSLVSQRRSSFAAVTSDVAMQCKKPFLRRKKRQQQVFGNHRIRWVAGCEEQRGKLVHQN